MTLKFRNLAQFVFMEYFYDLYSVGKVQINFHWRSAAFAVLS